MITVRPRRVVHSQTRSSHTFDSTGNPSGCSQHVLRGTDANYFLPKLPHEIRFGVSAELRPLDEGLRYEFKVFFVVLGDDAVSRFLFK